MAAEELIEVKFRLADGTDIGPSKYSSVTTVGSLKEKIISQWPKDKENGPKSINDLKLINAGKILENSKTLAESRSPVSEIPGGAITMLVVLRPPMADKSSDFRILDVKENRHKGMEAWDFTTVEYGLTFGVKPKNCKAVSLKRAVVLAQSCERISDDTTVDDKIMKGLSSFEH